MKTFTIISTKTQKKYVIETEATTMAELLNDMTNAGIDYTDMTLYEGLTKAEYNPNNTDAILPHDIPYKGITTSNLVFRLTAPQKKIKSGAMSYVEMKSFIKNNNLTEAFKNKYNKNYTQGSTAEYNDFITGYNDTVSKTTDPSTYSTFLPEQSGLLKAVDCLINILYNNDTINTEEYKTLKNELPIEKEETENISKIKSPFSDKELDDMFENM